MSGKRSGRERKVPLKLQETDSEDGFMKKCHAAKYKRASDLVSDIRKNVPSVITVQVPVDEVQSEQNIAEMYHQHMKNTQSVGLATQPQSHTYVASHKNNNRSIPITIPVGQQLSTVFMPSSSSVIQSNFGHNQIQPLHLLGTQQQSQILTSQIAPVVQGQQQSQIITSQIAPIVQSQDLITKNVDTIIIPNDTQPAEDDNNIGNQHEMNTIDYNQYIDRYNVELDGEVNSEGDDENKTAMSNSGMSPEGYEASDLLVILTTVLEKLEGINKRFDVVDEKLQNMENSIRSLRTRLSRRSKICSKPPYLPISSDEEFHQCIQLLSQPEKMEELVDYFTFLGGFNVIEAVAAMVKNLLNDDFSKRIVYYGKVQDKLKLKDTLITRAMFDAASSNNYIENLTMREFEQSLNKALDCSKQRSRNKKVAEARNVLPKTDANLTT